MSSKSQEEIILPRRFELIKKMYFSDRVIAPTKKDKILDWFFSQFSTQRSRKSSLTYKLLWQTFYDILVEEKRCFFGHRILIKNHSVRNFLEAVLNYPYSYSWAHIILSSIATFLQTSTVNATLIADIDTLLNLLVGILKIISQIYRSNSSDEQSLNEGINLANIVLDILENLPASDEEETVPILSKSVKELAFFIHISDGKEKLENLSERVAKKIISVIFNLKNKQYETLLTPVKASMKVEPNRNILQFLLSLQDLLTSEALFFPPILVKLMGATFMKKILLSFLIHNRSSLHSLKVLALLFAVCGLDIPIILGTDTCCKSLFKNCDISILGISYLLESCCAVPQYFTSMAVPEEFLKPSMWLKGVSASLLNARNSENKVDWFKCFQCFLTISPTILEYDVLPLTKTALLNITVKSTESKKQYCKLFNGILQAHSQLHQIPKFFVKFLLALTECIKEESGGNLLENGQILPEVEECIAKCISVLPSGQMIELWKIFIETFSTFEIMTEVLKTDNNYLFLVAQLFSTFLLHAKLFEANIPLNIQSQFSGLIKLTSAEIQKNVFVLKLTDLKAAPLKRSVLLLSYAIGEVKLAYSAYYEKAVEEPKTSLSEHTFDCSPVHSFLGKDYAGVLECFLKKEDKILAVLVFQLLLQKMKALHFKGLLSEEETSHMQKVVSTVLHNLQACHLAINAWDMDLCLVTDENYGTVIWKMFLKVFPVVLSNLGRRDYYALCSSAHEIILANNRCDDGAKAVILSSLKHEFFQESKHFQTAFISVIWKKEKLLLSKKRSHDDAETEHPVSEMIFLLLNTCHSKAFKYAQRSPKSEKNLGSMWEEIKEISKLLNTILLSESLPKDQLIIDKLFDVIKLFNVLPLEYLLPGNQMKCIIGLSFLLFLSPQSCKQPEGLCLVKEISSVLVSIFQGVRSVWLFNFVTSGPYVKYVVKTLEAVISDECVDFDWAINLIDHLISLIVKGTDSLNAIEHYISKLATENKTSRTTLITFYAFLKKLSQVLPQNHHQDEYRNALRRIASVTCFSFVDYMKLHFNQSIENINHSFFIKCYTLVIEIICCPAFEEYSAVRKRSLELLHMILAISVDRHTSLDVDVLVDVYLLFISKISKHNTTISAFIPEDFESVSWSIILFHFEKKAKLKKKNIYSAENTNSEKYIMDSKSCCVCLSKCVRFPFSFKTDEQPKGVLEVNPFLPLTLNDSEKECLRELSIITSSEKLKDVFQYILNKLGFSNLSDMEVSTFHIFLLVLQCLINSNIEKCHQPILNNTIQKCLIFLHRGLNQICESQICQNMILIPILDFMDFILKTKLGLPKQLLFQSLHCVVSVPVIVRNDDYDLYARTFTAAWNVVYDLFMHHTAIILASPSPFLAYVSKLLKSIIKAGSDEPLSKCSTSTFQQIQLCAENMNRLLTMISRHKTEFSKLVPYLVADYVDTVQHITLESNIKESILSGIYRLLNLCSEDSIQMLAVNINHLCKEIYGNLVKNYKQNKYRGSV